MAKSGTLYTYPDNFRAQKALIAAKYSGFKLNLAKDFVFGQSNLKDDFLAKFPSGKVPAFESADICLTESNAIGYYVANSQLRGGDDLLQQALVHQWMEFADAEILPAASTWVFPTLGVMQFNKTATEKAKEEIKKAMGVLNAHLLHQTFLVGERITLADISVACTMLSLYRYVMDPSFRKEFINVNRWFLTIVNQKAFKDVLGTVTLCEKMAQFDAKKFAEIQGPSKKEVEKKEKKKEEKKAPKPKKEEPKEEPMDDDLPVPEKKKDPFDAYPKGTWDMDDFKRNYSNNDESVSIPYFWEKFDKENYSIWRGDYKYNEELTQVFMSCNLIGGMYQRLEKLKKNAFASCGLFGENNNSSISGIWVWRGHDLAFELSEDWKIDYISYDWKKLDANDPEVKKMVDNYFSWQGTDAQGRKFAQGKIFK